MHRGGYRRNWPGGGGGCCGRGACIVRHRWRGPSRGAMIDRRVSVAEDFNEGVTPSAALKLPVTVAIPTLGRDEILLSTVQSVLALRPPAAEVLVVDQSSGHRVAVEKALDAMNR